MTAQTYTPYVEPPKVPSKMSFFSEQHAASVARIPGATPEQHDAARRVLAQQPDGDRLALMIFGVEK